MTNDTFQWIVIVIQAVLIVQLLHRSSTFKERYRDLQIQLQMRMDRLTAHDADIRLLKQATAKMAPRVFPEKYEPTRSEERPSAS